MKIHVSRLIGAGTSAMNVGLGFFPDEVHLFQSSQAEGEHTEWNRLMQASAAGLCIQGITRPSLSSITMVYQTSAGIALYFGRDVITTASANYVIPKQSRELFDSFGVNKYAIDQRDRHTGGTVTAYTQDSTNTGHFNCPVDTTYVGVGSKVVIEPNGPLSAREYYITAITSDGDASTNITLNAAAPSGTVRFIGYMYDFVQAPAGTVMPIGIAINDVTYHNVSGQQFIAKFIQW